MAEPLRRGGNHCAFHARPFCTKPAEEFNGAAIVLLLDLDKYKWCTDTYLVFFFPPVSLISAEVIEPLSFVGHVRNDFRTIFDEIPLFFYAPKTP